MLLLCTVTDFHLLINFSLSVKMFNVADMYTTCTGCYMFSSNCSLCQITWAKRPKKDHHNLREKTEVNCPANHVLIYKRSAAAAQVNRGDLSELSLIFLFSAVPCWEVFRWGCILYQGKTKFFCFSAIWQPKEEKSLHRIVEPTLTRSWGKYWPFDMKIFIQPIEFYCSILSCHFLSN